MTQQQRKREVFTAARGILSPLLPLWARGIFGTVFMYNSCNTWSLMDEVHDPHRNVEDLPISSTVSDWIGDQLEARITQLHTWADGSELTDGWYEPSEANLSIPATQLRLVWGGRNRRGDILNAQSLRRRIKETALRWRRMVKKPRLSPAHVALRERCAKKRVHRRLQQLLHVIFTDASRFYVAERTDAFVLGVIDDKNCWRNTFRNMSPEIIARIRWHLLQWKDEVCFFWIPTSTSTLISQHLVRFAAAVQLRKRHLQLRTSSWPPVS